MVVCVGVLWGWIDCWILASVSRRVCELFWYVYYTPDPRLTLRPHTPTKQTPTTPLNDTQWVILSEETQLVAAFVAFGTTVYKYAGGAIAKSLDERQEVRVFVVLGLGFWGCVCGVECDGRPQRPTGVLIGCVITNHSN